MKKVFFIVVFIFIPVVVFAVPPDDPNTAILERIEIHVMNIENQLSASGAFDWNKGMSFIAGLLTSSAIVISASRRN